MLEEGGGSHLALSNQRAQLSPTVLCCIRLWATKGSPFQLSYHLVGDIVLYYHRLNGVTHMLWLVLGDPRELKKGRGGGRGGDEK